MLTFLKHQLLSQLRSVYWQKNVIVTILTSLFYLYLFLNVLAVGFFADLIIEKVFPEADLIQMANRLLFYYFIFDIVFRFILQKLPGISIEHYSQLPIKKAKLLHFPIVGSLISPFNVLPIIIILIFFFKQIISEFSWLSSFAWLVCMVMIIISNNLINFGLKKRFSKTPIFIILIYISITILLIAEGLGFVSVGKSWVGLITMMIESPFLLLIPLFLLITGYLFAYQTMAGFYYPIDKVVKKEKKQIGGGLFKPLRKFGVVGRLVEVELKLILRNKRPRTMLMLSVFFGFYFYTSIFNMSAINNEEESSFISNMVMIGFFLFATGWLMIMYGQLLFAWESNYFDGIISKEITALEYISAKYWLIALQVMISVIFIIPAAFLSFKAILIGLVCLIFNLGVNSYFIIFAGMFNTSKVEPNKTAFMNYQGANVIHFFLVFLLVGIPALVFIPFQLLGMPNIGIVLIGGMGISGFLLRGILLQRLAEFFQFRKHTLAKGYKEF